MRFLVYRLPAIAYMALIFLASSGPVGDKVPEEAPDWALHGVAYLILYLLVFWAVHEGVRPRPGRGGYLSPMIITVLYGMTDEYHQSFVVSRDASVRDVLADAVGAAIAAFFIWRWSGPGRIRRISGQVRR